jgi:hypothetical protein
MPVWSVFIALALLVGFAVRFALFGSPRVASKEENAAIRRAAQVLGAYVVLICAVNFLSVIAQCGLGECRTLGYRLLPA